jgi:hypothetical protein
MMTLGKEFGVSGNAVAKVCKKLRVPMPCRGHWAKIAHGKRSRRLQLPPRTGDVPETATIDPMRSLRGPKPLRRKGGERGQRLTIDGMSGAA